MIMDQNIAGQQHQYDAQNINVNANNNNINTNTNNNTLKGKPETSKGLPWLTAGGTPGPAQNHTRHLGPAHRNQHLDYVTKESLSWLFVSVIIPIVFFLTHLRFHWMDSIHNKRSQLDKALWEDQHLIILSVKILIQKKLNPEYFC